MLSSMLHLENFHASGFLPVSFSVEIVWPYNITTVQKVDNGRDRGATFLTPQSWLWAKQSNVDFLKKWIMWGLWVKFYLGQNEDYSLGDSTSDSSEKLLQKGRAERTACTWFWWRGSMQSITLFFFFLQKVSATHEEQLSPWKILVFF